MKRGRLAGFAGSSDSSIDAISYAARILCNLTVTHLYVYDLEKAEPATGVTMSDKHKIVSKEEWIEARKQLLAKEKEFTRLRDELSRERRELPWERVSENYVFDGPKGKESLSDLFDGRTQLII